MSFFTRRKSRSGHNTAYTGVNHAAPLSSQPSSNALAAALTIGHGSNALPNNGGSSGSRTSSIQRSPSMQAGTAAAGSNLGGASHKSNSLLKRSPSVYKTVGNRNGPASVRSRSDSTDRSVSYNFDDSVNDSYLDGITEEHGYDNHEQVKDLKLLHSPQPGHNLSVNKRNSFVNRNNAGPNNSLVKMVKKYIPTPNGIKVIEVPEVTMQKEISRNNSMRSGANIPRTSSINSLNTPRTARRQPSSRLSSLVKSPPLGQMKEEKESATSHQTEYDLLQKKIDEEREFQRKLELKKLEYEELKRRRTVGEGELKRMEAELNEGMSKFSQPDSPGFDARDVLSLNSINEDQEYQGEPVANTGLGLETLSPSKSEISPGQTAVEKPVLNDLSTLDTEENDNTFISPVSTKDNDTDSSDYLESPIETSVVNEGKDETETSIDPAKIKVDELEGKKTNTMGGDDIADETVEDNITDDDYGIEEVELDPNDTPDLNREPRPKFDTVPSIISPAADEDQGLMAPGPIPNGGSSGSSISSGQSGSPSRNKRPMKSAMKNSSSFYNKSNLTSGNAAHEAYLSLATAENTRLNSKLSAGQLNESNNAAMYNQSSHHYPTTTASNINKRMSQTLRKPPPGQGSTNGGFANKTLRPQSMQGESGGPYPRFNNTNNHEPLPPPNIDGHIRGNEGHGQNAKAHQGRMNGQPQHQQQSGGFAGKTRMSDRSLRDRSSYVQPISPHPALQPNYQSLSKAKAAELYEKANRRPHSSFNLQRRSSFSNEHSLPSDGQVMQRTTLREPKVNGANGETQEGKLQPPHQLQAQSSHDESQTTNNPQHSTPVRNDGNGLSSRFADSDDDNDGTSPASAIFSSRFVDSDDESKGPIRVNHNQQPNPLTPLRSQPQSAANTASPSPYNAYQGGGGQQPQMFTLRQPAESKKPKGKEIKEKKKFGKLKKLFSRS